MIAVAMVYASIKAGPPEERMSLELLNRKARYQESSRPATATTGA
jgi:hypothetical protein